ncbi:MAG: hydroxymethylbilane synthase [Neisseria elongata]
MNTPKKLVIASRESMLAMWQAEHIKGRLKALYPDFEVEILGMTTRGDQILDRTLSKIGGKGLFIKELEQALQDGRADLAVHSIKDVPMELPEGFALAAIGERASPFDAFVSNQYARLEDMPEGAIVGTSSLRREAQLRAKFPHLTIKPLRGTMSFVGTRPEVPDYVRQYTPQMRATLLLPAGVTSTASIEFKDEAQILAFAPPGQDAYVTQVLPAKMRLNLRDVRDFSIGRDLRIAFRTILAVAT